MGHAPAVTIPSCLCKVSSFWYTVEGGGGLKQRGEGGDTHMPMQAGDVGVCSTEGRRGEGVGVGNCGMHHYTSDTGCIHS